MDPFMWTLTFLALALVCQEASSRSARKCRMLRRTFLQTHDPAHGASVQTWDMFRVVFTVGKLVSTVAFVVSVVELVKHLP